MKKMNNDIGVTMKESSLSTRLLSLTSICRSAPRIFSRTRACERARSLYLAGTSLSLSLFSDRNVFRREGTEFSFFIFRPDPVEMIDYERGKEGNKGKKEREKEKPIVGAFVNRFA